MYIVGMLKAAAGMDTGRVDPRFGEGRNFWNALFFFFVSRLK